MTGAIANLAREIVMLINHRKSWRGVALQPTALYRQRRYSHRWSLAAYP